jgi:carbonic anhydrase
MLGTGLTTSSLLAFLTSLLVGCPADDSVIPTSLTRGRVSADHAAVEHAAASPEFGYFGATGPGLWGGLDPAWGACANGHTQSPVDLAGDLVRSRSRDARVSFDYDHSTTGEIFNNGHTVEIETEGKNVLTINGVAYSLTQFHFHSPSEHTINGDGYDMELHLVHTSATGATAVVAVFLDRGHTSGALSTIFDQLPNDVSVHHELEAPFDVRAFLPQAVPNVQYIGSLTTPPCTDGVHWVVLVSPETISSEQLAQFHERIHFNARPVQRSLP